MKKLALILATSAALVGGAASAQAYEWGGGYGYGPAYGQRHVEYRDGYRGTRFRRDFDDGPAVRVYEHRSRGFHHHDWDDDDD